MIFSTRKIFMTLHFGSYFYQHLLTKLFSAPTDSILASVIKTEDNTSRKAGIKDYSIYRTPSGKQNIFSTYDIWNVANICLIQ
jgi:hypothetical protein